MTDGQITNRDLYEAQRDTEKQLGGLALQAATLVWFAIPWLRTFGKNVYSLFAPPAAERDSKVAMVTAPLDGAVLEASERMEW